MPGFGFLGAVLGWGSEVTWGTKATPTKFAEVSSGKVDKKIDQLHSKAIAKIYRDNDEHYQGGIGIGGAFELEARYEGMELLFYHAMGSKSALEVASFAVTDNNKYIDFKEDAGSELTATATASTYKMGERSHYLISAANNKINFTEDGGTELTATLASAEYATAALLAAQIKTQLEAAGAGTYTVAYSATTGKFTITVSGDVSTFQLLWKTGTNGSDGTDTAPHDELGFLDDQDGVDAVSDSSDYSTIDPSGTLCAHLKTILEAAGEGTYTVTFSNSTKKITIAVATGASAVQFLWKTGTHGSDGTNTSMVALLGFTAGADGGNGASDTGDSAVVTIFDHTFTLADALPAGITFEFDEDISAATIEGGKIDTFDMSIEYNDVLRLALGVVGEDKSYAAATSPTLSTAPLVTFVHGALTYGTTGARSITNAKISLNNNLKKDRRFIGSQLISEPIRNGKRSVSGSFTIEFDSVDADYADFVAATSCALALTFTGAAAKTGYYYTMTVTLAVTKITASTPNVANEGVIMLEVPFEALATDSSTQEMSVVIRNTLAPIQ